MINKQGVWFLTLFCLVLVLGVYYITMPNDLLKDNLEVKLDNSNITVSESDVLASLRVERDEKTLNTMEELETVLTTEESTAEEKNTAFEELKILNLEKGKETSLEEKVEKLHNIKSIVDIDDKDVIISINSSEHSLKLANDIMRCIQEEFEEKIDITVKFQ